MQVDAPRPPEMAQLHAELQTALQSLPDAPSIDPSSARSLTTAAVSALTIGRADDAVILARAALALDVKSARAWSIAGDALFALDLVHDARVAYEEAVALDDKDLPTAVACARALVKDGEKAKARALLNFVLMRCTSPDLIRTATDVLEQAQ